MGDYWPIGGHKDKGAKMAVCAVGKHVFFLFKNEMARKSMNMLTLPENRGRYC